MRRVYLIFVLTVVVRQGVASPPEALFSPPPASGVPSLHLTSSPLATAHPETRPNDAALASPRPQGAQNSRDGWDALRRETLPEPVGSPTSQAWRWLVGLAAALALIPRPRRPSPGVHKAPARAGRPCGASPCLTR